VNYDETKDEIDRLLKPKMHLEQKLGIFFALCLVIGVVALEVTAPKPKESMNPLSPPAGTLCKIVSVLVHADEMRESQNDPHANSIDRVALYSALDQPDVKEWIEAMTQGGFAPIKRSRPAVTKKP
jgi:hypothetical protein